MGVMDRVLVFEAVVLIAYTAAVLVVFWHTSTEPGHPDRLRVWCLRPGKRRHGLDQDQQGQGGGGRRNERERHPAAPEDPPAGTGEPPDAGL